MSQKLVIICAIPEVNLSVLGFKIGILRQKLVIICATLAGVNLRVLAFKLSVLRQKLVITCVTKEIQAFYWLKSAFY